MTAATDQVASDEDVLDHASASLTLHVRDLDASVRWYSSVFGTRPVHRGTDTSLDGVGTSFAVFLLAGMKVFLSETGADHGDCDHESHPPTLVFMTRRPLGPLRHQIESRGALFRDETVDGFPADADGVRAGRNAEFLWFYDLDGNKMEFCRVLKKD
ncbi:VOC family protein [Mycobacterium intracellulare]|uniref:VOC family protein n=1 Tax=Mycobacterium intracellulare TaxID=1767 RepID=UPI001EEED1AF|nr:VOC family protein [Mycobacterium intracellulare]MEE3753053.1 VOC family protein [Mycobacterium intracellulare]